ncbi:MAG: Gfo/Idh/MocA family oxidoreductase [Verrucomicrobiaceae bacterium]|nr:Gfo/Idh/MocA family oxidoreductase [Verrucomicrobiaceae bacterium]
MSQLPSILVLGCGSIGERHLRCFQKTGRVTVAGCDTNPALRERIASTYGVPVFDDYASALNAQAWDGVVVCVPANLHTRCSLEALAAGAGVLIEKPLAISMEGVDRLIEVAARSGRYCAVAYVFHVMPWMQAARDFLLSGELGRPLHLALTAGQHFPTFRPAYREIYYTKHETGGGAIQDALTHLINAVEWIVGPVTRLYCDASHQMLEGVTVEDTVNVSARHGDVLASYAMTQFQAPSEVTLLIHAERGSLRVLGHKQTWSVMRHGEQEWTDHVIAPLERDDLFIAQANAYLDGLEGKPTPLSTIEEGAQTLRVNIAALRSVSTAQPITL